MEEVVNSVKYYSEFQLDEGRKDGIGLAVRTLVTFRRNT